MHGWWHYGGSALAAFVGGCVALGGNLFFEWWRRRKEEHEGRVRAGNELHARFMAVLQYMRAKTGFGKDKGSIADNDVTGMSRDLPDFLQESGQRLMTFLPIAVYPRCPYKMEVLGNYIRSHRLSLPRADGATVPTQEAVKDLAELATFAHELFGTVSWDANGDFTRLKRTMEDRLGGAST